MTVASLRLRRRQGRPCGLALRATADAAPLTAARLRLFGTHLGRENPADPRRQDPLRHHARRTRRAAPGTKRPGHGGEAVPEGQRSETSRLARSDTRDGAELAPELVAFASWFADWWLRRGQHLTAERDRSDR